MKKSLLTSLLMMLVLAATAAPVSKEQARQNAVAFMQKINSKAIIATTVAHKAPRKTADNTGEEAAYYYVFNAQAGQGFVIVSGDDRTEPILGYSDTGSFDENHMPDNLRAWLKSYQEQIQWLDDNNIRETADTRNKRTAHKAQAATRNTVEPLVTSVWDQTEPFHDQCPVLTNYAGDAASTTYTGCVATAMAQVMYYNRWPQAATKTVPGYTMEYTYYNSSGQGTKKSLTLDALPSTTFDWANMIDDYQGSYTSAQGTAVSTLMVYCGHSVEMVYGTNRVGGSGTQTSKVAAALVNYFGYDNNTVSYANRNGYTIADWNDLIYNELKNGRAVVYSGQSDGGGHAFVCDGFSHDDYFHINWGWSGSANGYFLLSVLNPYESGSGGSSTSNGFSYGQGAVIGIQPGCAPADGGPYDNNSILALQQAPNISGTSQSAGVTTQWTITLSIINQTSAAVNLGKLGFNVYKPDGTYVTRFSWTSSSTYNVGYYYNTNLTVSNTKYTTNGTYILKPFYYNSSTAQYIEPEGADIYNLTMVVASNKITSIAVNPNPSNLIVENVTYNGDAMIGINQSLIYTIRNTSATEDFNGKLYLFANSKSYQLAANGVYLRAGEAMDIDMNFTAEDLSAGTYSMILATDADCNNRLHTRQLTLNTGSYTSTLSDAQVTAANGTRTGSSGSYTYTCYGDDYIEATVTCTNNNSNPWKGQVTIMLYKGNSYIEQEAKTGVFVPGNGTATLKFYFAGLDKGSTYYIYPLSYTGNWTQHTTSTHKLNNGYSYWTADGTRSGAANSSTLTVPDAASAVDLTGLSFTKVNPNSNPNTLYYIGESQSIPNGLSGKNIIKGETASNITLTAGYGFFAPRDFTAANVTYTRTFTKGHGNTSDATDLDKRSGWETIVLPFEPTSVTCEGNELSFFISDEDETGEYWLYEYGANDVASNTVYFTYPEKFYANRPFIIAVPGDKWGDRWNLTGKAIVFSAANATVYANPVPITSIGNDYYKFVGNYTTTAHPDIYALNTVGNTFVLSASTAVAPFGAYFKIGMPDMAVAPATLNFAVLSNTGNTTGIDAISIRTDKDNSTGTWFTLDGRQLNGYPTQKGIYINNGRKVIIK